MEQTFYMKEPTLVDLSKQFAISIIKLCQSLSENRQYYVLANQLLRSGTSIGANIHEANYAASRADFISKMQIALKECYETSYWLELLTESAIISKSQYDEFASRCGKLRKKLIASVNTAKGQ